MNKEETRLLSQLAVLLYQAIEKLDVLHKTITDYIIQKGEPNVKDPGNTDVGRN